jgi:Protein of unknown function (DUF3667)
VTDENDAAVPDNQEHCLNCRATLVGQYCGQCGQRATNRLISLWELIRDAFGDLFELDSRLWRTLVPLLARPGQLTRDYLEGRRARYMPPFRMYLVLSVLFFVVAFSDWRDQFEIFFEPEQGDETAAAPPDAAETARIDAARSEERAQIREALDQLVREGVIDESLVGPGGVIALPDEEAAADAEPAAPSPSPPPAPGSIRTDDSGAPVFSIGDGDIIDCKSNRFEVTTLPGWMQRRLTPARLQHLCERWKVTGDKGFTRALLDRVPAALILLLPLMALVQKFLYPLSRRYYVEHLLFFVHFHSFLFLLLTLQILWARLIGVLGLNEALSVLPIVASSFYVPFYLFVSMRRVYGQGRFLTFLKFSVLLVAYSVGFSLILLGALLLTAVSV